MDDSVFIVPITFASHDGKSTSNAKLWTSAKYGTLDEPGPEKPRAIIQIVHGMSEHIDRYDHYARYLVEHGFVVCAEDHVGHGDTAPSPDDFGHMPVFGGKKVLLEDVNTLRLIVSACYPDVDYVIYGHSMGSFISRAYITRYGEGLSAVVLSGSGNPPVAMSKAGRVLAVAIAAVRGKKYRSELLSKLTTGDFGGEEDEGGDPNDWLSTDKEVLKTYADDPKSGFIFTTGGYATLLSLTSEVGQLSWAKKVPKDLPMLFISGDEDPVGEMGKGVLEAAELYRKAGVKTVDVKLYEGKRHELHNEVNKIEVFNDVIAWIEEHLD